FNGVGKAQRSAISLVGGIGPITLILHLEGVPFESHSSGYIGNDLMGDGSHVLERLLGRHEERKPSLFGGAVDFLDLAGLAGAFSDGMKHREAKTVTFKGRSGRPVHAELDGALLTPRDAPSPAEINIAFFAFDIEVQLERSALKLGFQI